MLLLAICVAALLRFWQLGQIPPGLYRDEAINGLDALDVLAGQRQGQSPFYFAANNGREPAYIYLTTLSILLFGRSVFAIRLAAAIVGTLTTWVTYKLAKTWFDQRIGLLSAWIWAITIWPIHLSRIGLRPVLLPLTLSLSFWLGTLAYRRQQTRGSSTWMWLLTGIIYGSTFYTYLAARFTVAVIAFLVIYLALTGRRKGLWPGLAWSALGFAVVMVPMAIIAWQEPELIIGRTGQVSIFSQSVNEGDFLGTLWRQGWSSLALFFVKGDTIVRHNPPGRPVFDLILLIPFLIGLVWCLRNWRRAPCMALLLWVGVMLGPTILAEDAPHFLRAVGVLPGLLMMPAIGLSLLWTWTKLPSRVGQALAIGLLLISLLISVNDYFLNYGNQQTTAYWFEAAARDLAEQINNEPIDSALYVDRRFRDGWPSTRFLVLREKPVDYFEPHQLSPDQIDQPAVIYAWPYEQLDQVTNAIAPPALVNGFTGSFAQGDLETAPYPLFVRYTIEEQENKPILANFDNNIQLRGAEVTILSPRQLQVDLFWSSDAGSQEPVVAFIHIIDKEENANRLIAQSDSIPSQGNWPVNFWKPGLIVDDQHTIELETDFDINQQQILVGLYWADSLEHLEILNEDGDSVGDTWLLRP